VPEELRGAPNERLEQVTAAALGRVPRLLGSGRQSVQDQRTSGKDLAFLEKAVKKGRGERGDVEKPNSFLVGATRVGLTYIR